MEATSREVEEFTFATDTRDAKLLEVASLPAALQCGAGQHRTQCRSMDGKVQEGTLYSGTSPWMVGEALNELPRIQTVNSMPNCKEIKETMAAETMPQSHQQSTSRLQATSMQYFPKFRSKELKAEKQEMKEEKKQKRLWSTMTIHSDSYKTGRKFKSENKENRLKKLESKYDSSRETKKRKYSREFRSIIRSTLPRLLMLVMFLPWSEAASKSLTPQQPTVPSGKTYLHLTLQPPAQFHQPADTTNFAQASAHQSQETYFTVAPTPQSDAFSSRSEGSIRDGRVIDDQRSHFLVNDINIEQEDSAASVNEVQVGDTDEEQERQQNELQQRLRKERETAAHKWAPVVWLHPKEIFFPGDVLDFVNNVNISSSGSTDMEEYGADAGLPQGPLSEEMHLIAPLDTGCGNCPVPGFLHGQRPFRGEGPPVYAHIHTCYSPIARTTTSPTMNLLLRTPPNGEQAEGRSLRAQIRSLQHPLPRYRRRRRLRGRGRRDTVNASNQQDTNSQETVNETHLEEFTRQQKKLVLTEDQKRQQNFTLPKEGKEETERKAQEGTSVSTFLTSTAKIKPVNSDQPTTEPTRATNQGVTANLTTSKVSNTSAIASESNTRSHPNERFNNSFHTDVATPLKTETPRSITQEQFKFTQSQAIPNLTQTSQPIIIFGNYSRMRQEYATAVPSVFQTSEQKNSSNATTSNTSSLNEDTQRSGPSRRHALSTTGTPGHHFTITYWFFYPYNHGKEVCTANMIFIGRVAKPLYRGECLGETVVMGNHVGDWEHLSIYFEDGEPRYLYLSAHNFGAFYTYQPDWNRFKYSSQDTREGVSMSPEYPQYLELQQGRLVVYSAKGSHGTWPDQGRHMYNNVMVRLEDETGQGHSWDTRHNVHIIDALQEKREGATDTHRKWFDFRGKWGNPSSNCHPGMLGFCEIRDGPLGIPMKRLNFPCHIPKHYTFPKP